MPAVELRPRSVAAMIDTVVHLMRQRYADYLVVAIVPALPAFLVLAFAPESALTLATRLCLVFSQPVTAVATAVLVSGAYRGETTTTGEALRKAGRLLRSSINVNISRGVLVLLGALLLIVPGFIVLAWVYVALVVLALEGTDINGSLRRSRELARGSVGRILGTWLAVTVAYFVAVLSFGFVVGWIAGLTVHHLSPRLAEVAGTLGTLIFLPLAMIAPVVVYHDLRIRKEGLDLELLAADIDRDVAQQAGVPAVGAIAPET